MTDTDSYLLKCALEELDKRFGKPIEQINEECACKYGYVSAEAKELNNKTGE